MIVVVTLCSSVRITVQFSSILQDEPPSCCFCPTRGSFKSEL